MLRAIVDALASDPLLVAGGAWVLRAAALLLITWLVAEVAGRASAAVRHAIWAGGLAGVLALPLLGGALPWQWAVLPSPASGAPGARPTVTEPSPPGLPTPDNEVASDEAGASGARPGASSAGAVEATEPSRSPGPGSAADRAPALPVDPAVPLLGAWAAGASAFLLVLLRGAVRLRRARRGAEDPDGALPEGRVEELARRLGVRTDVRVRVSDEISVPLTVGLFRPEILLPRSATSAWPPERLESVLLHELAHVKRRDVVAHLAGRVLCALQWCNPLVWLAARRMTAEAERACDDEVLRAGTRPSTYARHLLDLVRTARARRIPAAALSMARPDGFEERVAALLERGRSRSPLPGPGVFAVGVGALLLTLAVSLPSARADAPAPDAGAAVADALVELLQDPHPAVRASAAHSLGERKADEAVAALGALLEDSSPRVRLEAARALGRIESPAGVESLARTLVEDSEPKVRRAAAWALGETERPEAVPHLARALDAVASDDLRRKIVKALGETRQPAAVPVLDRVLARGSGSLREEALESLVELGEPAGLERVLRAARSDDPRTRVDAARALGAEGEK